MKLFGCRFLVSGPGTVLLAEIDSMEVGITLEKKPCSKILFEHKVRAVGS